MSFNSLEYALFFLVVYALYLSLQHKGQNRMLLVASYIFYAGWDWRFLILVLISTSTDYLCAKYMNRYTKAAERRRFVWISVAINLSILGFFKYFNFFIENFVGLFALFGLELDINTWQIILPVGISFYTFQTMSYTIDVYRKQVEPAQNFFDYALYVSFFPQLVAGPIERGKNLMPQIVQPRTVNRANVTEGLFLIYWGLFKKIFIADNLGTLITLSEHSSNGGILLVTTYMYLIRLYCDFSAYTDIARGTSKMMGFELMLNFRTPFLARNIQDVWQRWHISLSSWIRDYLYYPLVLTRIGKKSINPYFLVIVTFVIMGFWHGAAWNFIFWGAYNGTLLAVYTAWVIPFMRRHRRPVPVWWSKIWWILSIFITFNLMSFGNIFFRFSDLSMIGYYFLHIVTAFEFSAEMLEMLRMTLLYALPLMVVDILLYRYKDNVRALFTLPAWMRYSFLYLLLYLMIVHPGQTDSFIYFQF